MIKIKICGIRDPDTALRAVECGADALGFVFASSPRRVSPEQAKEIARKLPRGVWKVGVFVNSPRAEVLRVIEYCGLDVVQLHGDEHPDYCQGLGCRVWKAFRVRDAASLTGLHAYRVEALLLDAYQPGVYGGTGRGFDLSLAREAAASFPIILAGGLTPDNVAQALESLKPYGVYGVDVSSGVETGGSKDPAKIARFIREVRRWESERVT